MFLKEALKGRSGRDNSGVKAYIHDLKDKSRRRVRNTGKYSNASRINHKRKASLNQNADRPSKRAKDEGQVKRRQTVGSSGSVVNITDQVDTDTAPSSSQNYDIRGLASQNFYRADTPPSTGRSSKAIFDDIFGFTGSAQKSFARTFPRNEAYTAAITNSGEVKSASAQTLRPSFIQTPKQASAELDKASSVASTMPPDDGQRAPKARKPISGFSVGIPESVCRTSSPSSSLTGGSPHIQPGGSSITQSNNAVMMSWRKRRWSIMLSSISRRPP